VKIITAHSSKGLEFPIVFFVGAEKSFTASRGAAPRYVFSEGFGLGMYARTPSGLGLVENPTKAVINEYSARARTEEEARVLYVALTRARERLYVVASKKNPDAYLEEIAVKREYLDEYSVYSLGSFLDMILMNGKARVLGVSEFIGDTITEGKREEFTEHEAPAVGESDPGLSDELLSRFSFVYPSSARARIPEKVSVSRLYPEMLNSPDVPNVTQSVEDWRLAPLGRVPEFIKKTPALDAKARGIATHMLLQFCDLERLAELGAKAELDALVRDRFLSESDRELVRLSEVELFLHSRLFERMRGAKKLYREFRFNVMLPSALFVKDGEDTGYRDEKMLVQGVIDCLIEDSDGRFFLIDYKTDRLTKSELSCRALAEEKLRLAHSRQLGYYAEAVKIMFGKYPERCEVYSMPLGDTVDMKLTL